MKKFSLNTVLTIFVIFIQSVIISRIDILNLKPDLTVFLVVFLGFNASFNQGLILSFISGYLMDLLSGSPPGFFSLIKTVGFLLSYLIRKKIVTGGILLFLLVVALISLLEGIESIILVMFLGLDRAIVFRIWNNLIPYTSLNVILAILFKTIIQGFKKHTLQEGV